MGLPGESLELAVGVFILAAFFILVGGVRMARVADELADRTGMGEAIAGAIFVGGATSLPGLMTTTLTAWNGLPTLSVSNAIGGIAVQTLWLVVADFTHRGSNLEHAAASSDNLIQGGLLIVLLSVPLLAMNSPPIDFWGVHPASLALVVLWVFGMRLVRRGHRRPMWYARHTSDTIEEEPDDNASSLSLKRLWVEFTVLAGVMAGGGYALSASGSTLTELTVLSESVVGGIFTGASSSLPELVVCVAAVRRGAITLAFSNIVGGNCLDTLFLFFADLAYREGSIYHAVALSQEYFISLTVFMTGALLMGLVHRERRGFLGIGFESGLILLAYVAGVAALVFFPSGGQ